MSDNPEETIYKIYRTIKKLIQMGEDCCERNHLEDPDFKKMKKFISDFDGLDCGYAERYEKEKQNETNT